MSATITAVVVSGVIAAYAADKSAKSQEKGIEAQTKMSKKNLAFQREISDAQRQDFQPWREVGESALQELWTGIQSGAFDAPTNVNVQDDPGYQFRLDEGIKALDRSAAARGRLIGTRHDKNITNYAQGVAANEYANAYTRELNKRKQNFNMLAGLSNSGMNAAARQGGATAQLGASGGNIMNSMGANKAQLGLIKGQQSQDNAQVANQALENWMYYNNNSKSSPPPNAGVDELGYGN